MKNVTDAFKQSGMWDNTIMIFSTGNKAQKVIILKQKTL